jgi:hypothetical protein
MIKDKIIINEWICADWIVKSCENTDTLIWGALCVICREKIMFTTLKPTKNQELNPLPDPEPQKC